MDRFRINILTRSLIGTEKPVPLRGAASDAEGRIRAMSQGALLPNAAADGERDPGWGYGGPRLQHGRVSILACAPGQGEPGSMVGRGLFPGEPQSTAGRGGAGPCPQKSPGTPRRKGGPGPVPRNAPGPVPRPEPRSPGPLVRPRGQVPP